MTGRTDPPDRLAEIPKISERLEFFHHLADDAILGQIPIGELRWLVAELRAARERLEREQRAADVESEILTDERDRARAELAAAHRVIHAARDVLANSLPSQILNDDPAGLATLSRALAAFDASHPHRLDPQL